LSALTKVFVVLVAILSVVLVAVMVTFVANQENYKQRFNDEFSNRSVADTMARRAQAELDASQDKQLHRESKLAAEITTLTSQLMDVETGLADAKAGRATLISDKIRLEGSLAQLGIGSRILIETNSQQRVELDASRQGFAKAKSDLIQTADLLSQKMTHIEILEQELRYSQEQLTELIEENAQLVSRVQTAGVSSDESALISTPLGGQRIEGGITRIEKGEDATYVQLNVGSVDGVSEGMEFTVHHEWQFKGNLVIHLVDDRSSSGKITLMEGQVTAGDQVMSRSSF